MRCGVISPPALSLIKHINMIQLKITKTGKSYNPKDHYKVFDDDIIHCSSLDEAKKWLEDKYGSCKRTKMYQDPNGDHIGYIYHFRDADFSHYPVNRWLQQDWVKFCEVKPIKLT